MKYLALLGAPALVRTQTILGPTAVSIMQSSAELIAALDAQADECIVLDPSLLTPSDAKKIAVRAAKYPVSIVAYASLTNEAMEACVILARQTNARFVFRGSANERAALARTLIIAPEVELGDALVARLSAHISALPREMNETVTRMLRTGVGPTSSEGLASESALARRSVDRWLTRAGFRSGHLLIGASRIVLGYRAITSSRIPLKQIAAMLGYTSQRTMDSPLQSLLGVRSSRLRRFPLSANVAAAIASERLVDAERRTVERDHVDVHRDSDERDTSDETSHAPLCLSLAARGRGANTARAVPATMQKSRQ